VNPIGLENIGWKYYIVFCCFLVVIITTVYFTFPETKGYSLEEIATIFDGPDAAPASSYVDHEKSKEKEVEMIETKV
jgi:hypothetical protein